eukprot:scaffold434_cov358-Prasinococcus_capsulatus_cf.AAC.11
MEVICCEPYSASTDDKVFHTVLLVLSKLGRHLFAIFNHPARGSVEAVALIMRTIAEQSVEAAAPVRDAALRDGAVLRHLFNAIFATGIQRRVSEQLLALWLDSFEPGMCSSSTALPAACVGGLRSLRSSQACLAKWVRPWETGIALLRRIFPKGLLLFLTGDSKVEADATEEMVNAEGKVGDTDSNEQDTNVAGLRLLSQVSNTHKHKLTLHWDNFWRAIRSDHCHLELIWNETTRAELRAAVEAELRALDTEREREADKAEAETAGLSWNYAEFHVLYPSLSQSEEVSIQGYFLRLLLDAGETAGSFEESDVSLHDPNGFFHSCYHQFLTLADSGLTLIDGPVMHSSAGSGRELCLRAMTITYQSHADQIGAFEGGRWSPDQIARLHPGLWPSSPHLAATTCASGKRRQCYYDDKVAFTRRRAATITPRVLYGGDNI